MTTDIPNQTDSPGMSPGSGDYPRLRLPEGRLFATRANRLRHLAQGHGLADFLAFTAQLVEAQQILLDTYPDIPLPDRAFLQRCQEHGMAPLAPAGWALEPSWRQALARLVAQIQQEPALPAAAQATLRRLAEATEVEAGTKAAAEPRKVTKTEAPFNALADQDERDQQEGDRQEGDQEKGDQALAEAATTAQDWLDSQARLILDDDITGLDLATAPFIGAALQVHWTRLAAHLTPDQVAPPADQALCPVCGSPPVAAVIRAGVEDAGLRYLHCALCNSQWHRVRAECSQCGNDRDLGYYHLEGRQDDPVSAEACPACQGYLKICRLEKDHLAEPLADDLASLTLDLLMGEEGFARAGVNLLLWQGTETAEVGQDDQR